MVMSYKNKKENVIVTHGSNKKSPQGSKFTPFLNDGNVINEHVVPPSIGNAKQTIEQTIIKLYRIIPHKIQTGNHKQD